MDKENFRVFQKKDIYHRYYKVVDMDSTAWLRIKFNDLFWEVILGVIVSIIISVGGMILLYFKALPDELISSYLLFGLLINTLITIFVFCWGKNQKGGANKRISEYEKAADLKVIAAKDAADTRINNVIASADNNAVEAVKWEKYCRICFDRYTRETLELRQKLQGTQEELRRYQNAPPGAIHPQENVDIVAHIAKPSLETALFLEVVKELEKTK